MAKDVEKTPKPATKAASTPDASSRLKRELMKDAVGRMLGQDDTQPMPEGPPRVLLAFVDHGRSPDRERIKTLQRDMFAAAGSGGMQMKFGFYSNDDEHGVRRCQISRDWKGDADTMDRHMDRAQCSCGCFVYIRSMLEQAVKENTERPMRAVVIVGDAFHDDQKSLDEAALAANQVRREGTRVFLIQQGDNPDAARRLQYLARVAGAMYFQFDETQQQQQFADILNCVSTYAAGGEDAVKAKGGQAATLLLEHLKQQPMEIIEPTIEKSVVNRRRDDDA